ncbi:MAG: pantoate--beta-alanine ligase [Gammaproteobacteria bacterium]|nr:pantoate--beta-alanine ligase [Gammaproteobacteria bacterium]MYA67728.1 pantoate--beta-alanine ligase [Gammaproteobacteria bacterium]MYG97815.1 pantoate--beta-alanine ligase [Gammaproteobacteria bacterium]MYH47525.1 pantoate--beta-alanine ligase [Gammaproteobacteria bacterium]MYL12292.1 pantoate--beta-alanine ligase [Gammaproteobacteria bacterium]
MRSVSRISDARAVLAEQRRGGCSIGLVPTMGNIHVGHLALLERCRAECDFSVVTIFVNPLQFGPKEDYTDYPRTLDKDRDVLSVHGCDLLLHPTVKEVYGEHPEQSTRVHVPDLSERWCGASRPGHFDGVATVVTRLFNFVQPETAYLGLKDYQQFLLIRKLVTDLGMNTRVAGVETMRESDGLAMSSRNAYLSADERRAAPALYRELRGIADEIRGGERDYPGAASRCRERLSAAGFNLEYLDICDAQTLRPASIADSELVILAAAFLGGTRLIDNLRLAIDPAALA